jgi:hypothetical protein
MLNMHLSLRCCLCRVVRGSGEMQDDTGLSWMTQLGPKMAVAALDTRSSRTRERIVPEKLVETMLNRARNLPSTVQHLLFVSAVPVQYAELQFMEKLVGTAEGNTFLKKTGLLPRMCLTLFLKMLLRSAVFLLNRRRKARA